MALARKYLLGIMLLLIGLTIGFTISYFHFNDFLLKCTLEEVKDANLVIRVNDQTINRYKYLNPEFNK